MALDIWNLRNLRNWQFTQRFLRLCVPLVLVLVAVLWLLYRTQVAATLTIMEVNERQSIQLASQTIDAVFGVLRGDALYLAEHSALQEWLDTDDIWTRSHLIADFLAFTRHRHLYDHICFMNENGQEVVRINWNDGQPIVVPEEQLQNKWAHRHVQNTLARNEKTVLM